MKKAILTAIVCFNLLIVAPSYGQPGTLDSSFGVNGKAITTFNLPYGEQATTVILQQDGKIVQGGITNRATINSDFALVRYQVNGSLDSTFGLNGKLTTHFDHGVSAVLLSSLAIQNDGKIIAGGELYTNYGSPDNFALARYKPNGGLDSSFGINGKVLTHLSFDDELYDLKLQLDGKVVIAGSSQNIFTLIRYTNSGIIDSSFGNNGLIQINTATSAQRLTLLPDGKFLVGGLNFQNNFFLVRYSDSWIIDSTFGTNGYVIQEGFTENVNLLNTLLFTNDDKIILLETIGDNPEIGVARNSYLYKYTSNGIIDSSFATNGILPKVIKGAGGSLLIQNDGKLIVTGLENNSVVVRLKTNGGFDSSFGTNGKTTITQISGGKSQLQSDGRIIVGGLPSFSVARVKSDDPVTISIKKNIAVTEGNSGTAPAQFQIVLNKPAVNDVFVNYATKDLTALAGSDYSAATGTVKIKAGKTKGTITASITGDNTREKNEKFALVLSNPANAVLGTVDSVVCTIRNDDPSFTTAGSDQNSAANPAIKIYPNPVKDVLRIEGLPANKKTAISITDMLGKTILSNNVSATVYTFNIKQLSDGVYYIKIETDTLTQTLKFIKE